MDPTTHRYFADGAGLASTIDRHVVASGAASAHISPSPTEVPARGFTAVTRTVRRGCDGPPTARTATQVGAGDTGSSGDDHRSSKGLAVADLVAGRAGLAPGGAAFARSGKTAT